MASAVHLPLIRPMLATLGPLPTTAGWAYEFKWDGVRTIASLDHGELHLWSRNDLEVTASYPELAELRHQVERDRLVLDGEIVALDERSAPSFSRLQQRMHVRAPTTGLLARVPVKYYVFDLLHHGQRATLAMPYAKRRSLLEALGLEGAVVQTPPSFAGGSGNTGADVMRSSEELGLEGVVAKRLDSPYQPGTRSRYWIKTPLNKTVEVVIAGWRPGAGRRAGLIGALLLGMYDDHGQLVYVGKVGTGFTEPMLRDMESQLKPLARPTPLFAVPIPREDARDAHWVAPQLVGEVAYRTVSPDGRLRHPSWRGLRPDRDAAEVKQDLLR
jgi:bifunctional non-homologous end joining protein LigD